MQQWVSDRLRDPASLSQSYQKANPFPHIVVDDAFDPALLRGVLAEFPAPDTESWTRYNTAKELKLFQTRIEAMPPRTAEFLSYCNSAPFIDLLEQLTGIDGLIPDPYLWGGGLHQIARGGFLKVHADFNWHNKLRLHRRLNVLVYLNEDWREEFGGHLELWSRDMKECRERVLPLFNRMVVFSTTDDSYHGHPHPLACPEGRTRKSIALYYYSATRPRHEMSGSHATLFQRTPGEALPFRERVRDLLMQLTPPIVIDAIRKRRMRRQ
jgi:hypothetical protein